MLAGGNQDGAGGQGEAGSDPSLERRLAGHKDAVSALAFSPAARQLASASLDSSLMLWNLRGPMRSYRFQGHKEAVLDVAYSPSGKYLASVSRDKTVRLWVPTVTGSTGEFKAHSQTIRSVQFTSDSLKLVTASDDKIIKLWSATRQKFISSFIGHTNWVRCARLSCDNSIIASCSDDKTMKLWDIDNGECIHTFTEQKGCGQYLDWHPSGCYVAVGLSNGTVKLYDTRTHSLLQHYRIHDGPVTQLAFHPSGSYLLTCSKDNKMKVLDLLEGHPVYTLTGHTGAITAVTFSPDGDYFASGGEDKQVLIWKTNFAELKDESAKENSACNLSPVATCSKSVSSTKLKMDSQGSIWNNTKRLPIGCFMQLNSIQEDQREIPKTSPKMQHGFVKRYFDFMQMETPFFNVGDLSHIPRLPPSPHNITVPKVMNTENDNSLLGLISLKDDETCYTNGTIEWVGKKRCFSKAKLGVSSTLNTNLPSPSKLSSPEPLVKRHKPHVSGVTEVNNTKMENCECSDIMPTINTIVDHLTALHDAIEIVEQRLNTVEDILE